MRLSYLKKMWPLLLLGVMPFYGCDDAEDKLEPAVQQNLYVVLDQEPGLDSLARAIDVAGLKEAVANSNLRTTNGKTYTIFAPNNDAFIALLKALELKSISKIPNDVLIDVLSTHILPSTVFSKDLKPVNIVSMLNNQTLEIRSGTNGVTISVMQPGGMQSNSGTSWDTKVTRADLQASNGVVHVIDKVILPK